MYDCRETRELLGLYLDSELETVPTKRVSAHLEQCAPCRRELEALRSQDDLLARSVKGAEHDTAGLRAAIEAATFGRSRVRLLVGGMPRVPAWAAAGACAFFLALVALLYVPGLAGLTVAAPLHAAAVNHRTCGTESGAPDWTRSQAAIAEAAAPLLGNEGRLPHAVGDGYRLARARFCLLDGERFLHVVYEGRGGREASLFIGRAHNAPPAGERRVTLDGHILQLSRVADLNVTSTAAGDSLLIAAAPEEQIAAAVLVGTLIG
ncbi:MAG: zf-HC2 domain-containing protein [Acidobacteria bacterium]|nr:zf-HC2 domain-containing protein [Acidobacteriota bacterium]